MGRNEAILRASAAEANDSLRILAELIDLTSIRAPREQRQLVNMVGDLLGIVRLYAQRKHLLASNSGWFIPEYTYPRWVEAQEFETTIALNTSTPIHPRAEPVSDWLERRAAELVAAALEACVTADNRDCALLITTDVAATTSAMARNSRVDDAIVFASLVRDRCWRIKVDNAAAIATAAAPPLFLSNLLMGWREALDDWKAEIERVVDETKWDRRRTNMVQIRGPKRAVTEAQRLLRETKGERDIQGYRETPDWYLRFALANTYIFSLRELVSGLRVTLDTFLKPFDGELPPQTTALIGLQALQALAKAQLFADILPETLENLEALRMANTPQEASEIDKVDQLLDEYRYVVLQQIADSLVKIQPTQSKAEPDIFGQALFTLVHHMEEAIATGNTGFVEHSFPKVLQASIVMQDHVLSVYRPPTYQPNASLLDPTTDILELSGLAMIYATLRKDHSDAPVSSAWKAFLNSFSAPEEVAKNFLSRFDLANGNRLVAMSQRDIARHSWELRVTNAITDAGYAVPERNPFNEEAPAWDSPLLFKILGVHEHMRYIGLKPRVVFVAEVLGPLSGESDEELRRSVKGG